MYIFVCSNFLHDCLFISHLNPCLNALLSLNKQTNKQESICINSQDNFISYLQFLQCQNQHADLFVLSMMLTLCASARYISFV